MKKRLLILFLLLTFLLGACAGPSVNPELPESFAEENGGLSVHFIDVGQADCILIQQGEHAMLIDAGNNDDSQLIVDYLQSQGAAHLEYVVGTHPHEDHIGSLDTVLRTFHVHNLLMPKIQANTQTFEDVLDAAAEAGLSIVSPKAGNTFLLGDAVLTAVSKYRGDDLNNNSIMLRLTYGNTSFLFTGDAEAPAEEAALRTRLTLQSDVLKVGHHGSSSSTSQAFLEAVAPTYAVISCGENNDYGHPHRETLTALAEHKIFRTDRQGTVVAYSNGNEISWNVNSLSAAADLQQISYVINLVSRKFHLPSCSGVETMAQKHRANSYDTRQQLLDRGFTPCGGCNP